MNILDEITAAKRKEVEILKQATPARDLERSVLFDRQCLSLKDFILDPQKTGIIAEFKRRSPSKGVINDSASVESVTTGYAAAGASALSVLTDLNYFGGTNEDLLKARAVNAIPILRKDFVVDEYQVIEAKSIGADAILLIAAVLERQEIKRFSELAASLSLSVLLELHEESEFDKIDGVISVIGINNRNLKTFAVDVDQSILLAHKLPKEYLKVSESGIDDPRTIKHLKMNGYKGFLIGENFMKTPDPGKAMSEFVKGIK